MLVRDLMTQNPVTVEPNTPLRKMITIMHQHNCRQLPVLNRYGELVGIVTDRDIRLVMKSPYVLHERWEEDQILDQMTAAGCMTQNPLTILADAPAVDAARLLLDKKFGALPVMESGRLVGIITVSDFLRRFVFEHETAQSQT